MRIGKLNRVTAAKVAAYIPHFLRQGIRKNDAVSCQPDMTGGDLTFSYDIDCQSCNVFVTLNKGGCNTILTPKISLGVMTRSSFAHAF